MKKLSLLATIIFAFSFQSQAYAQSCKAPGPASDMTAEQMDTLYECLRPIFVESYAKKKKEIGVAYSSWKGVSTRPAAPGVHSGQHLMTYVNDIGFDQYIQYNADNTEMPIGTIIAKESFTIKDSGKIKYGPLLIMTKVGDEKADTGGWDYTGLKPNGKTLKVDKKGFCHACHQAYAAQDSLGYPVPDVRVTAN